MEESARSWSKSLERVYEHLLEEILSGRYGAGGRLPPERELATNLGTSRATVREALRELGVLGLVEPRRGSGIVVRPPRSWSFGVLPAYVRLGAPLSVGDAFFDLLRELLGLRRALVASLLDLAAPRLERVSLERVLEAAREAHRLCKEHIPFVRANVEVLRALVETANMLPSLWLLNGVAGVYVELARALPNPPPPPACFRDRGSPLFRALEANDARASARELLRALDENDQVLMEQLGVQPA